MTARAEVIRQYLDYLDACTRHAWNELPHDTGEHPLQDDLLQQDVIGAEVRVRLKQDLLPVDGPGPRPGDRDPAPAHGDRALPAAAPALLSGWGRACPSAQPGM